MTIGCCTDSCMFDNHSLSCMCFPAAVLEGLSPSAVLRCKVHDMLHAAEKESKATMFNKGHGGSLGGE